MKRTLLVFIASLVIISTAAARIGEALDELVTRFGKATGEEMPSPTFPGLQKRYFEFKNWQISVDLLNGRSACEEYRKKAPIDAQSIVRGGEFSQEDVDVVLGANSVSKQWTSVNTIDYFGRQRSVGSFDSPYTLARLWITADHSLICADEHFVQVDRSYFDMLRVFSKEYNEYRASLERKEHGEELKKSGL